VKEKIENSKVKKEEKNVINSIKKLKVIGVVHK
jgi:hypothetical protein